MTMKNKKHIEIELSTESGWTCEAITQVFKGTGVEVIAIVDREGDEIQVINCEFNEFDTIIFAKVKIEI